MARKGTSKFTFTSWLPSATCKRILRNHLDASALITIVAVMLAVVGCASQRSDLRASEDLPSRIVLTNGPPEFRQYDESFVNEVQERWYGLLDNASWKGSREGKVVVRFHLHDDGRVTDTAVLTNTTSDIMLGLLCEKAILDPQPYPPWPQIMRDKVKKSSRGIDFTFYYNVPEITSSASKKKSRGLQSSKTE
jgi:hypothetical protein